MRKLIGASLSAALAFAPPASAADNIYVPPGFFGMNLVNKTMRPVYVSWASHSGGSWSNVASCRPTNPTNPSDPCYGWGGLDTGMTWAKANGLKLQYNMGYAPPWSNGSQGTQYPPTALADYTNWATAYLTRYAGKIDAVTVWNEVSDPTSATGYAGTIPFLVQMENSLCGLVHKITPTTLCLAPNTYYGNGLTYHVNYMAAGGNQTTDAFSWHAYPLNSALANNLEQWANTTLFYKALLAQYGRANEPIYVTEGGYSNSTADPLAMGSLFPLFMACFATMSEPYAWDRPPGGNTSLDYWLGSAYPGDSNGRGTGYKTMQAWLIGATITQCPKRQANTNTIRNPSGSTFTPGIIGSGGVMPQYWSSTITDAAYGVVTQVVGSCDNGNGGGVKIRLYTPTTVQTGASGSTTIAFESNGQVTATYGQQMNVGVTVSLAAGSMSGLGAQLAFNEYNAGNGYLASTMGSSNAPVVPIASPVPWSWKATIASPTAAYVIPKFGVSYSVGAAFDASFCLSDTIADTGSIWYALISRPGGYTAKIMWDSAHGPTTTSVDPTYTNQRDVTNASTSIINNTSTLTQAPRLFESAPIGSH